MKSNEPISQDTIDLVNRGQVTWDEYRELRKNSYEQEILIPAMSDDCLLKNLEQNMLPNCVPDQEPRNLPARSYDHSVLRNYLPELIRRLRVHEARQKRHKEFLSKCASAWIQGTVLTQNGEVTTSAKIMLKSHTQIEEEDHA
jgi:hypothetical protein